jgi:hypothetical protein
MRRHEEKRVVAESVGALGGIENHSLPGALTNEWRRICGMLKKYDDALEPSGALSRCETL